MTAWLPAVARPDNEVTCGKERFRVLRVGCREFIGKSTLCPKLSPKLKKTVSNPAWLANELVYYEFAKVAGLQVPEVVPLQCQGELFVGSEFLEARTQCENAQEVARLARSCQANLEQATKALLLDLALLNCDREPSAVLKDAAGGLWFIDHDKSLWGDCRPADSGAEDGSGLPGDLGRIDPSIIERKLSDFVADYLNCAPLNQAVWVKERWQDIHGTWASLPLQKTLFDKASDSVPSGWIPREQVKAMGTFLSAWWCRLGRIFEKPNGFEYFVRFRGHHTEPSGTCPRLSINRCV